MSNFDMPKEGDWKTRGGWVVRRLMNDLSMVDFQAAGLVGNLGFESEKFATYHEKGVPEGQGGVGWAQWTAARRRKFEAWCTTSHLPPASDEANYGFLLAELRGPFSGFLSNLRRTQSVEDACLLTHKAYETPSDVLDGTLRSQPARLALAKELLDTVVTPAPAPADDRDELSNAIKMVQELVGVTVDGRFGPVSYAAVRKAQGRG